MPTRNDLGACVAADLSWCPLTAAAHAHVSSWRPNERLASLNLDENLRPAKVGFENQTYQQYVVNMQLRQINQGQQALRPRQAGLGRVVRRKPHQSVFAQEKTAVLEGCRQTKKEALADARKEVCKVNGVRCLHTLCGDLPGLVPSALSSRAGTACSMCMQVMDLIKSKHCNPILVRLAWHDSGTYDKVNCLLAGWLAACLPNDAKRGQVRCAHLVCTPVPSAVCSSWHQHSSAVWGMGWQLSGGALHPHAACTCCRTSLSGPSAVEPMGP